VCKDTTFFGKTSFLGEKKLGEGKIPLRNGSQREVKTKEILDKKIPTDYTDYTD
jgi:hypothetical protein